MNEGKEVQTLEKGPALTPEQVNLIKNTVARGTTNDELQLFLYTAKRTGLDPLLKQIHAVKRFDSREGREIMAIQTGIDGYRLIADRTGDYAPGKEPTYTEDAQGNLVSATAYVKKRTKDGEWHEVAATAYYSEYAQTTKDGKPTRMWAKMPHVMLAKCAESLALRRAFPAEMSGLYTSEEMGQAEVAHTETPEVVDTKTGEIASRSTVSNAYQPATPKAPPMNLGETKSGSFLVKAVTDRGVSKSGKKYPYTIETTDGYTFKTWTDEWAETAKQSKSLGFKVGITYKQTPYGLEVVGIDENDALEPVETTAIVE